MLCYHSITLCYQTFSSFVANGTTFGTKEHSDPLPETESTKGKTALQSFLDLESKQKIQLQNQESKGPSTASFLAWCRKRARSAHENIVDRVYGQG